MPNATQHRLGAATAVCCIAMAAEHRKGEATGKPFAYGGLAAVLGTLPDSIEPALNPNHRQFFHSLTFAAGIGVGLYKLYKWQPEAETDKLLKAVLLVAGGAYLVHLAMDGATPKSLPLI